MQLRVAEVRDLPAMLEIYRPYVEASTASFEYETPTAEIFAARFAAVTARYPWLVAEEDGRVLGYAYASRAFERVAYQWDADVSIYLCEEAHGRGIGRALYARLEELMRGLGYCTLYALITGENEGSLAFHRAVGYHHIATFPRSGYKFGRWLDVHWYEKSLCEKPQTPPPPRAFAPEMNG